MRTRHLNSLCGQNVGCLDVKLGGTCNSQWVVKGKVNVLMEIKNGYMNKSIIFTEK